MKSHQEIERAIERIESQKREWLSTRKDKIQAHSLLTKISFFYHSIESEYSDFFDTSYPDIYVKVLFEDAKWQLERYSESKLKVKDDCYFDDAMLNIERGMNNIKTDLGHLMDNEDK